MRRFVVVLVVTTSCGRLVAAPVPPQPAALVASLSDPSAKVRDEAAAALRGRADALPWLRRAGRSADKDTARRAAALVATQEPKRQTAAATAIDACIKSGQADLFMEWHHYWQPENKDDLWPVGPRMVRVAQVVQGECAKWFPPAQSERLEVTLGFESVPEPGLRWKTRFYDGPLEQMPRESASQKSWCIRTDRWWKARSQTSFVSFASIGGPAWVGGALGTPVRSFVLGPVQAFPPQVSVPFVVCDGGFYCGSNYDRTSLHGLGNQGWAETLSSFVACRGDFCGASVFGSVLLVDGDVELHDSGGCNVQNSLIRASGEIRMPKGVKVVNSKIEPHAKNATAPYRFFELADVGLSLVDDEEGMVVAEIKPKTAFGNSGLKKGDVILAIDDSYPGGCQSEFRVKVRRALVRQGDCLLTVARGDKTLDVPVYFPLPK